MRRLPQLAAALLIVTAVTVTATLADGRRAESATRADAARPTVAPAPGNWVTLVTGDRVLSSTLAVDPAPRSSPVAFQQMTRDGDDYVVPADAAELLRAGKLDWQLFNVSGLVRQGYDDAHRTDLPLLVRYDGEQRSMRSTASLAGASVERVLPAVTMASLDVKKSGAARVWNRLRPRQGLSLAGGIGKVWLNGKVKASLDVSVPRIGAPAAWAKGLTGAGVTVAILDTGVDIDHPDLTGRIGTSQDFSGKGTVEDGNGHGTHVASTVAGTGAASGGRYRGVAPAASLAIGKVLDDSGNGTAESVIAGMQWAATQTDAKVVNLSLGGAPTDGTDPVSAAVDTLSREHGTLFVAAAGNDGEDENVAAPAAADEALAVGSVNLDDAPSGFSNRGPRLGDGAVKPELVAPGEGIVAARPADIPPLGEPVDAAYQRLDGTSMATPHVTGSAALVAQQHPSWTGAQLKSVLMSTAAAVADASVYTVGTGRVDVDKATAQSVTATGSVSVDLPWPNQDARETRAISWRNTSSTPVSLALDLALTDRDGAAAPAGLATLSASTLTIPANGTAAIEIAIAAQDGKPGRYSGVLTGQTDGISTRTALSIVQEEEKYDLTVALTDRDGQSQGPQDLPTVSVQSLDDPDLEYWGPPGEIRLPKGRYGVHASIQTPRAGQEPSYSFISAPELRLDHDLSVSLDARLGRPLSITPPDPAAVDGVHSIIRLTKFASCGCSRGYFQEIDPRFNPAYAATLPGTESDTFALAQRRRASEEVLGLTVAGKHGFGVKVWGFPNTPVPTSGGAVRAVHGGEGTAEDLAEIDARRKLVVIELPAGTTYGEAFRRTAAIKAAGATLAMIVVKPGAALTSSGAEGDESAPALPTLDGNSVTGRRFAALAKGGPVNASYVINPQPTLRYELAYGVERAVTSAQVYQPRKEDLAAVRTSYHDNVSSVRQLHASYGFFGGDVGIVWSQPVTAPQTRTEYFTPGSWTLVASGLKTAVELSPGRTSIAWNKAVAGPTFRGTTTSKDRARGERAWARRKDGAIDVILPMFGDSAGRPQVPVPGLGTDTGSIELRREGRLVESVKEPDAARIPVPDEAATYRLTAEAIRTATWWPLSTRVAASWTFRSSAEQEGAALPLLTVRFDPAVDVRNRAPAGAFNLPVYVERQGDEHPKITRLAVAVSYDDGAHWQAAQVSRTDDHWTIALRHPKAGFVSLRATAVDRAGNTVNQTVIRGYEIGGKTR